MGSVASRPLIAEDAGKFLVGRSLDPEVIAETASLAARVAKPLDNTDFDMSWRKKVATQFVTYALQELRGDDMQTERGRWTTTLCRSRTGLSGRSRRPQLLIDSRSNSIPELTD